MKGAHTMKKLVNLALILTVSAVCLLCSCQKANPTEVLDNLVMEDMLKNESYNSFTSSSTADDPLLLALENGEAHFEGVYTAENKVWQFMNDGFVVTYNEDGEKASYTYSLSYSGVNNTNKYIELFFPEEIKKYRFKKLTANGFDMVYIDSAGDNASVFTFLKSSFLDALLNGRPFFTETLYQGNSVWNFRDGGILKTYGANGEVYNYTYNLEYVTNDETDEFERHLIIAENFGQENEYIVDLKVTSFTTGKFNAVKIENGKPVGSAVTFAKQ